MSSNIRRRTGAVLAVALFSAAHALLGAEHIVARVGGTPITFAEIHCEGMACVGTDQERLSVRVFTLVLDLALARADVQIPEREFRDRIASLVPNDRSLASVVGQHRAIASAALEVLNGRPVALVHSERLAPFGIPLEALDHFLRVTVTVEQARAFLARDIAADIRADLDQQIRRELKRERLVTHLATRPTADQDKFWSEVLEASNTVVLEKELRQLDLKGVLTSHDIPSTPPSQ